MTFTITTESPYVASTAQPTQADVPAQSFTLPTGPRLQITGATAGMTIEQ